MLEKQVVNINVRVSPRFREDAKRGAAADEMDLSAWVKDLIKKRCRAQQKNAAKNKGLQQ